MSYPAAEYLGVGDYQAIHVDVVSSTTPLGPVELSTTPIPATIIPSATPGVLNPTPTSQAISSTLLNPGFESDETNWTQSSTTSNLPIGTYSSYPAHSGTHYAWLDGNGVSHTDTLYQTVSIPSSVATATLSFYLRVDSSEKGLRLSYWRPEQYHRGGMRFERRSSQYLQSILGLFDP